MIARAHHVQRSGVDVELGYALDHAAETIEVVAHLAAERRA